MLLLPPVLLAGAACGGTDRAGVTEDAQTYQVDEPVREVVLDASFGEVTVDSGDGPVLVTETYRFSDERPATTHRLDGDTLRLTSTGCGAGVNVRCEVRYRIRVPRQTAAQLTTDAGQIVVRGLAGRLAVTTNAGEVRGESLAAREASVTTRAGVVNLGFAEPPAQVQVSTEAGEIEVRLPAGQAYAVRATTDLGDAEVTVDQNPGSPHRIDARTRIGAVRIVPS